MTIPNAKRNECLIQIVDDDENVRDSLSLLLRLRGWDVKAFASPEDFLLHGAMSGSGCLVLDVKMEQMDGLALQQALKQAHCLLPIVFLTGHGDVEMAVHAMQEGAAHFLQKNRPPKEIVEAIENVANLSIERTKEREETRRKEAFDLVSRLTEREFQILRMTRFLTTRAIAQRLGISERTVEHHRISVCRKCHAQNTEELLEILAPNDELNEESLL